MRHQVISLLGGVYEDIKYDVDRAMSLWMLYTVRHGRPVVVRECRVNENREEKDGYLCGPCVSSVHVR